MKIFENITDVCIVLTNFDFILLTNIELLSRLRSFSSYISYDS